MATISLPVANSSASMAAAAYASVALPPLPEYTMRLAPPLIPHIPDVVILALSPVLPYWIVSITFHIIDVYDLLPQYRLHTPEEITRRNRATRWEVIRDVVIQQLFGMVTCWVIAQWEEPALVGREEHDVAVWATRIRLAQRAVPVLLGALGVDAFRLAESISKQHPLLGGVLAGGYYPSLMVESVTGAGAVPDFAAWEVLLAKFIYWAFVPVLQYAGCIVIFDTWQYFLHRLFHLSKFLYVHIHSRHHRLYVPYAYGALYNHPLEGFLFDTIGPALSTYLTGLTLRQTSLFFVFTSAKTVDDHCGYDLPYDPLQFFSENNAAYHDIHHQTWGIKTNFDQPFLTFWDKVLGTQYKGPRADPKKRKEQNNNVNLPNGNGNGKASKTQSQ